MVQVPWGKQPCLPSSRKMAWQAAAPWPKQPNACFWKVKFSWNPANSFTSILPVVVFMLLTESWGAVTATIWPKIWLSRPLEKAPGGGGGVPGPECILFSPLLLLLNEDDRTRNQALNRALGFRDRNGIKEASRNKFQAMPAGDHQTQPCKIKDEQIRLITGMKGIQHLWSVLSATFPSPLPPKNVHSYWIQQKLFPFR